MIVESLIPVFKQICEVHILQQSLHNLLPTDKPYANYIVINYDNVFFTLSNENLFIILLVQVDKINIEKIKDKLHFIYNREKHIVSFEKTELENEFKKITYIELEDLIAQSEKNGTCKNNIYNLKLKEIYGIKPTYMNFPEIS